MKHLILSIMAISLFITLVPGGFVSACTSAVANAEATADGRPIVWKNRDTLFLSNKVLYVKESPYSYIGLVNAEDTGKWVYAGLNGSGFGIINTVAYNLPKIEGEKHELHGRIMADALRTCKTIDDFENYLSDSLGPSLGACTNFCVMDVSGKTAIFETHNNGFAKIETADEAEKYLVNTNFARSGEEGKGKGYLRFQQATHLFEQAPVGKISHTHILHSITRDFGHQILKHPGLDSLTKVSVKNPIWIYNNDCINGPNTSASVVLVGKKPDEPTSVPVFWVILGEPVTAIALPVFVTAGEAPSLLWDGDDAPLYKEAWRLKEKIRPYSEEDRYNYMNLSCLVNKEGTGFLPIILETEQEIFDATDSFLKISHTPQEYADFQDSMAQKALNALRRINSK